MSDKQNSNRVVDLSEYRAARAAVRARAAAPVPYLLWYPGVGYVQVNPATSAVGPLGLPTGKSRPGYWIIGLAWNRQAWPVKQVPPTAAGTGLGNGRRDATPSLDEEVAVLIRDRLKSLRSRAGLSLERLSRLAGVSRGMLSQIELGRSIPTITVLSRIAGAFEVPVSVFLACESGTRVHLMRHGESQELRSPDGKYISRALFPFEGQRRTEFYELRLEPDCTQESAPHATGTTENLVLSRGALVVDVAGAQSELAAGDSIYFVADVPHSYRNRGNAAALAYLVMSYPQPVNY